MASKVPTSDPGQCAAVSGSVAPPHRKAFKTEQGRKFILAGWVMDEGCSGSMCGLSLSAALPAKRLQAWCMAWRWVNGNPSTLDRGKM